MARTVVVLGLVLQFFLTALLIHRTTDLDAWLRGLEHGAGDVIGGAVALVLLLALVVPSWRGRRWALIVSVFLQVGLTLGIVPFLLASFAHPTDFTAWLLNVTYTFAGLTAAGFGVVAALEAWGRMRPRGWRSGEGAALGTVVGLWLGMVAVGGAVAATPAPQGTMAEAAEEVAVLRMGAMSFEPMELRLQPGKTTAVVLVNESPVSHSFDVDPLDIHVRVPGHSTTVTMIRMPAAEPIPFYCGIPGHEQAGMTGTLVAG